MLFRKKSFGYNTCYLGKNQVYCNICYITCHITNFGYITGSKTLKKLYKRLCMPHGNPDPLLRCHIYIVSCITCYITKAWLYSTFDAYIIGLDPRPHHYPVEIFCPIKSCSCCNDILLISSPFMNEFISLFAIMFVSSFFSSKSGIVTIFFFVIMTMPLFGFGIVVFIVYCLLFIVHCHCKCTIL